MREKKNLTQADVGWESLDWQDRYWLSKPWQGIILGCTVGLGPKPVQESCSQPKSWPVFVSTDLAWCSQPTIFPLSGDRNEIFLLSPAAQHRAPITLSTTLQDESQRWILVTTNRNGNSWKLGLFSYKKRRKAKKKKEDVYNPEQNEHRCFKIKARKGSNCQCGYLNPTPFIFIITL